MTDTQRRHFARVRFHSGARLSTGAHEQDCEVLDLCLKGALLAGLADTVDAAPGTPCRLTLPLDDEGTAVRMDGEVAHREAGRIGMICREIDLDSLTNLRRLMELNLGDDALLHREFSALIAD